MKYKEYILGFAFDEARKRVVLIEKQKPDWQKGKLNGVGGKLETTDKTIDDGMVREFWEETGVMTNIFEWEHFVTLQYDKDVMGGSAKVHCFRYFSDRIYKCQTIEEEKIFNMRLKTLYTKKNLIPHINFLIPMALDPTIAHGTLNMK